MLYNNVIIHYYPEIDCIAKCAVNMRAGKKIIMRAALKDPAAVASWLARIGYNGKTKTITHRGA